MPAHQTWSQPCEKMGMFTMLKRSAVDLVEKVKPLGRWKKNSKKSSFQAENLTSDAESIAEAKHYLRVKTMPHCQTQHLKIGMLHLFEKCFQYLTWFPAPPTPRTKNKQTRSMALRHCIDSRFLPVAESGRSECGWGRWAPSTLHAGQGGEQLALHSSSLLPSPFTLSPPLSLGWCPQTLFKGSPPSGQQLHLASKTLQLCLSPRLRCWTTQLEAPTLHYLKLKSNGFLPYTVLRLKG